MIIKITKKQKELMLEAIGIYLDGYSGTTDFEETSKKLTKLYDKIESQK